MPTWVDSTGQNRIIVIPGANNEIDAQKAISSMEEIGDISVIVGQCEIPMEVNHEVFKFAKRNSITTIFNFPATAMDVRHKTPPTIHKEPFIVSVTTYKLPQYFLKIPLG